MCRSIVYALLFLLVFFLLGFITTDVDTLLPPSFWDTLTKARLLYTGTTRASDPLPACIVGKKTLGVRTCNPPVTGQTPTTWRTFDDLQSELIQHDETLSLKVSSLIG